MTTYENYPATFVLFSNLITFSVYGLGAFIVSKLGLPYLGAYMFYLVFIELKLLTQSCVHCYYYGKVCFLGRGAIAALLFKKGDPKIFINKEVSWKSLIFDFGVPIIPLVVGLVLLILSFDWILLGVMIVLLIMGFPVTGYLHSVWACKYCKQRELGCPAETMFNQKK